MLYLAGHGEVPTGQEMFYFVPFDGQVEKLRQTAVSTAMLAEALRDLPARRIVLIIDACQSGGAVEALAKIAEVKASTEDRRSKNASFSKAGAGVGIKIIAATTPLAYAVNLRADRSALVATLLEILGEQGGQLEVSGLLDSVKRRLPTASQQAVGFRQVPLISSVGLDFALAGPAVSGPQ